MSINATDEIVVADHAPHTTTHLKPQHPRAEIAFDGATALRKLAEDLLGVPKVDDLWHGQNAITRGIMGPLAAKVEQAAHLLATAREAEEVVATGRAAYEQRAHGPGRPPNWAARAACAVQAVQSASTMS